MMFLGGPRSQRGYERQKQREEERLRFRDELKRLRWESYYDGEMAETVSVHDYPSLDVKRAEVTSDSTGYVHPSLVEDAAQKLLYLKSQQIGAKTNDSEGMV